MGKQNYRESVEKDHKELAEKSNAMPSRRSQRKAAKQTPEKERNLLLPVLFFIFILIPVALLFYIVFLYEPNDPITSSSMETEVSFETNTTPSKSESVALADDQAQEEEREETQKLAQQEAEAKKQAKAEAEAKAKAEAKAEAEAQAKAEAEAKAKAKAEAEAQAKAQAEALAKKQKEKEAAEKQQQKKSETAQPSGKTHVVQPGETLYRIAVNNYGAAGAASGVDKIKQANGLSSNEISPGQTLVLP